MTHSDALLREVVGRDGYNVFHMLPCRALKAPENQLKELSAKTNLDLALADLVGDLASYVPGGKVVILEGGGDSDFDKRVVSNLFPELSEKATLISGSNKVRVRSLLDILESAANEGFVPFTFFSITDSDSEVSTTQTGQPLNSFTWDAYHIENYFLEPKYIKRVLSALSISSSKDENMIWDELRECAKDTLPQLIRHEISGFANNLLVKAIDTKADPAAENQAEVLAQAVNRSVARIQALGSNELTLSQLSTLQSSIHGKFLANIADGTWVKTFRGRDVLKQYVVKNTIGVSYEVFRNLILAQMKDDNYKPTSMKSVVDLILQA